MTLNIHASAADNFNKKAGEFVKLVKEFAPDPAQQSSFPSDLHIAATLTEKDLIGEIEVASTDYRGKTISRFFYIDKRKFGLDEGDYKRLVKLAEQIQMLPSIRKKLSTAFIEKSIFVWIKSEYQNTGTPKSFMECLETEAKQVVVPLEYWIPIANLEVEVPFSISKSEIRPFSKSLIDKWINNIAALKLKHQETILKHFEQIRKDYQGLAAVHTVIEAEPEYAYECVIGEAHRITSILGIFSDATLIPDIKCVSCIKGSENIGKATAFFESDKGNMQMKSTILDISSAKYWRLSQNEIREIKKAGLDKISTLMSAETLNEFEKSVLNSVFIYSKSAFTADPVEKVVYMLSALESILLKNENEPIQHNLAERLAVFTAQELNKRKSIISTVKSAYGVRSRYLHHGHTSSELELISEFMMCTWGFFVQLIANAERFSSKEKFVSAIDDHKLG